MNSRPIAFLLYFLVLTSVTCAATFENSLIKVKLNEIDGINSWYSKKYQEDFFDIDVAKTGKDDLVWQSAGIKFGYLPGQTPRLPDIKSINSSIDEKANVITSKMSDNSGMTLPKGLKVTKIWTFSDRYSARLDLTIENLTTEPLQLKNDNSQLVLFAFPLFRDDLIRTELISVDKEENVVTVSPTEDKLITLDENCKWVGIRNQYYAFALKETTGVGKYVHTKIASKLRLSEKKSDKHTISLIGWRFGWSTLRPNEKLQASFEIYLGPKQMEELKETGFSKIFNTWSGMTGPIGRLMFALLKQIYSVTNSWGYAILLLTMLVKIILHPLNKKQMVAMKKMQQLQPKMQEIKEKFKNDTQRQNLELQKLFVENEVNPLGGCFPILVQIPIFVALYTCLSSAIELKRVPFAWITDLSQPDQLRILPILFCVGIYYSSKANSSGDPSQAMMMKIMPVFMLFIFWNMSAGVMLYIAGQSLFSLFEQQYNKLALEDTVVAPSAPTASSPPPSSEESSPEPTSDKEKKKGKKKAKRKK